jgi:hypothetical protein
VEDEGHHQGWCLFTSEMLEAARAGEFAVPQGLRVEMAVFRSAMLEFKESIFASARRLATSDDRREASGPRFMAEKIVSFKISPAEVSEMLDAARAPTYVNPEAPTQLSADCLFIALDREGRLVQFDFEKRKRGWRRAGKAASALKPLLREIIREMEYTDLERRLHPPQVLKYRAALAALEALQFSPPASKDPSWKRGAVMLAKAYVELVDPEAGWSENGPGVRFLALALNRIFHPAKPGREIITRAAIRRGLQRELRK